MVKHMSTVRITETELARDLHAVLEKVQQGIEIIVEQDHRPVAVIKMPSVPGRKITECIALAKAYEDKLGYRPVPDPDFAKDLEAVIAVYREPLHPRPYSGANPVPQRLFGNNLCRHPGRTFYERDGTAWRENRCGRQKKRHRHSFLGSPYRDHRASSRLCRRHSKPASLRKDSWFESCLHLAAISRGVNAIPACRDDASTGKEAGWNEYASHPAQTKNATL